MEQKESVQVKHAFEPVVDEYEVLQVRLTNGLGTYYLHPSQQGELEKKLSGYFAFRDATGYMHPILEITVTRKLKKEISDINLTQKSTEEKLHHLTTTIDKVVEKIKKQFYDTFLMSDEIRACQEEIERLERNRKTEINTALEEFEKIRVNTHSLTRENSYHEVFARGVTILSSAPISKKIYQEYLMKLVKAIICNVWGKISENSEVNHEKVRFLTEHVLPAIMKRG